jgi:hypothetical protein
MCVDVVNVVWMCDVTDEPGMKVQRGGPWRVDRYTGYTRKESLARLTSSSLSHELLFYKQAGNRRYFHIL